MDKLIQQLDFAIKCQQELQADLYKERDIQGYFSVQQLDVLKNSYISEAAMCSARYELKMSPKNQTMTTNQTLNAIDTEIANLQLSTIKISKLTNDPEEKLMASSREITYQECREIILKVMGGVEL